MIDQPQAEESRMTTSNRVTPCAHLVSDWDLTNNGRWLHGGSRPLIDAVSDDLSRILIEIERARNQRVIKMAEPEGWAPNQDYEAWLILAARIYQIPLNVMVRATKAKKIYGERRSRGISVWGPLDVPVSDAEVAERRARDTYRTNNMDATDPLRAVVEASKQRLPKPVKNPRLLYLAYDYRLIKREIGVFDSYDKAVEATPRTVPIHEVPADGCTSLGDSRLLRGMFQSGWGYAAGYSPDARANKR